MSGAFPVGPSLWLTDTRYYILRVQCDLFGGWELLKAWGGRGNRRGRHQMIPAAHEAQAIDMFERECRRRLKRGYRRVTDSEGH